MSETTTENALIPVESFNLAPLNEIPVPVDFDAAAAFFGVVRNAEEEIVDDFPAIDKARLVNVPFLLLGWTLGKDEGTGQYIVARGITRDGRRFRFADGSTGIFKQLVSLTMGRIQNGEEYPNANLFCRNGLRKSEYVTTVNGKDTQAVTFYIDNAID